MFILGTVICVVVSSLLFILFDLLFHIGPGGIIQNAFRTIIKK